MSNYGKLLQRRAVPGRSVAANERFNSLLENEDVKYLFASMEPLDADYTNETLLQAKRVYSYVEEFSVIRIQGSVMTNTHIRYHSDIDVITLSPVFSTFEQSRSWGQEPWTGDPTAELRRLRQRCRETISSRFYAVKIEDKPRSIRLSGGSLTRNVDLVAANWHDTTAYQSTNDETERGIEVLDVAQNRRILNKPFLHQKLINEKNDATAGGLGRAIRFLKNLKVDADVNININSYDIASLAWNIAPHLLPGGVENSFLLSRNVENALSEWHSNPAVLNSLKVPNLTRNIIDPEGTDATAVLLLWHENYKLNQRLAAAGKNLSKRALLAGSSLYQY